MYYAIGALASGSGAAEIVFSGNNLYDPNYSGGGHQPMFYDQLTTIYQRWRVTGSRITMKSNAGSNAIAYMWLGPSIQTTGPATAGEAFEQPYYVSRCTTGNAAKGEIKMSKAMSTKRIFGVKDISAPEYSGGIASGPVHEWFWVIGIQAVDNNNYNQYVTVKMTYYCQFEKRELMGQSVEAGANFEGPEINPNPIGS